MSDSPVGSIEDLGEVIDAPPPRPRSLARLVATLVGAGLGAGLLLAAAVWFFGGLAQTEAGFCRLTWAPCTSLTVEGVEALAGVELPEGTVVVSGYAQESAQSSVFRAEVVLPDGAGSPLRQTYAELGSQQPDLVPAAPGSGLTDLSYWYASISTPSGSAAAAQGTDDQGRTVILFDTHLEF